MKCFIIEDTERRTGIYFVDIEQEKEFLTLTQGDTRKEVLADTVIEIDTDRSVKFIKKGKAVL